MMPLHYMRFFSGPHLRLSPNRNEPLLPNQRKLLGRKRTQKKDQDIKSIASLLLLCLFFKRNPRPKQLP